MSAVLDDEEVIQSTDYLSMSDEDMLNMPAPTGLVVQEDNKPEATEAVENTVVEAEAEADDEPEVAVAPAESDEGAEEGEAVKQAVAAEKAPVETPEPEAPTVNYEAEYKRLLSPFKANGKDISVGSVDDAIALMQMGANYNKKMAALKPNLKLMKLLENNGLMNEEKISFLIELEKKSPDAINKLVKDSGIDPMDFDAEKAGAYKPKIHTVDDREIALDTVLEDIQATPTYNRTLEVVSKEWDGASKQVIANTPQLLKVINDHVASGIYDIINTEVERERVFGRLNGLSDIEAYRQVGDAIQARGGFNHLGNQSKPTTPPVVVTPKPKPVDEKLNEKRRAASSTKVANTSAEPSRDFNPLAMSDEEFTKIANARYR